MPTVLLADADVLIDYRESELSVLGLIGKHVGPLKVLSSVLDEVRRVAAAHCKQLGIDVIEAETSRMIRAAVESRVSFNDRLCFLTCLEESWTCVTNDQALHGLCGHHDVTTRFGLDLMVDLVACGVLSRRRAVTMARRIQASNPTHINERVLTRYMSKLDRIRSGKQR